MKCFAIVVSVFLIIMEMIGPAQSVINIVRDFVQNNIAGIPLLHETRTFDFNPDIAVKWRRNYYELHGFRGEKFIQRIGLGIDGKYDERLKEQENRDYGKLQGATVQKEYDLLRGRNYYDSNNYNNNNFY